MPSQSPRVDTTSARSAESETRQTTEKTATALLLLLKQWKFHAPPDIQAKIGPNPEVSVRVGEEVYKGLADSPAIKAIPKDDLDYLKIATGMAQGYSHADLTRDVEIKVGGRKVFEVAGGKVLLNQLGPEQNRKISVDIPGVTSDSAQAKQSQPEAQQSQHQRPEPAKQPEHTSQPIDPAERARAERVRANPSPPARHNVVSGPAVAPQVPITQQEVPHPAPVQTFEVPPAPVQQSPQSEQPQHSVQSEPSLSITKSDIEQVAAGGNQSLAMTMGRYLVVRQELSADKVRVSQPGFEYLQPKIDKAQRVLPEVQSRLVEAMKDAGIEPKFEPQGHDISASQPEVVQESAPGLSQPSPTSALENPLESEPSLAPAPEPPPVPEPAPAPEPASVPVEPAPASLDPTNEIVQGVSLDDPEVSVDLEPAPVPELSSEPGSREDVLDAARYISLQLGDRDGSGERKFEGAHFRIHTYGQELKVWDGNDNKVIEVETTNAETYQPSPELANSLISAANELERHQFEQEAEQEQEIDDGFEIGDD